MRQETRARLGMIRGSDDVFFGSGPNAIRTVQVATSVEGADDPASPARTIFNGGVDPRRRYSA
jgi:hypothetical protein